MKFRNAQNSLKRPIAQAIALFLLLWMPKAALATAQPAVWRSLTSAKIVRADVATKRPLNEPENADTRTISSTENRTALFDLEGNAVGEFAGSFLDTTPDGQKVITYSALESRSYLYSIDGTELAALEGLFQGPTPDNRQLITHSQGNSYLYDLNGNEQTKLNGLIQWSTLDGQYLITLGKNPQQFSLYSREGILKSTIEGIFRGFVPNAQQLVTLDNTTSRLYDFSGTLEATLDGAFQAFAPNGAGLITIVYDEAERSERSLLYDFNGRLKATFAGSFVSFSPDGEAIATDSGGLFQSWLYRLDGSQQAVFKGDFITFSPDKKTLFTYSEEGTHLYNFNGEQQDLFKGALAGITTDAKQLVTEDVSIRQSWLYDINSSKISSLKGLFIGFISNEQRIVTSDAGLFGLANLVPTTYRLYDLSGTLQTTIEGQLLGLMTTGDQGLVIYTNGKSYLYDGFDGTEQISFKGRVFGLTPDEQGAFVSL